MIFYTGRTSGTARCTSIPARMVPALCRYAGERGRGEGKGFNRNLPLAREPADDGWLAALDVLCGEARAVRADAVVVSLGLDAAASDPESPLRVTEAGYRARAAGSRRSGRRCSSRKAGMTWPRWAASRSRRSREPPTQRSASSERAAPATGRSRPGGGLLRRGGQLRAGQLTADGQASSGTGWSGGGGRLGQLRP